MKRITQLSLLLLLALPFFSGCSPDSSVPDLDSEENTDGNSKDITAPEVSILDFEEHIEVKSLLKFTVTDDSETTTKVLINGEEVLTSAEEQFSYEVNPYTLAVGPLQMRVISEDVHGNRFEEDYPVNIKHLLMDFRMGSYEITDVDRSWVFLNDSEGELLTVFELQPGSNKVYTEAIIEEETIYYTLTQYQTFDANYFHYLTSSSYRIAPGATRNEISRASTAQPDNLEIEITRTEFVNEWSKYTARGTNYQPTYFTATSAPTYSEIFGVSYGYPELIFLRTALENAGNRFDGKKENYRYLELLPEHQTTKVNVQEVDFKFMDDSWKPELPVRDQNSLTLSRLAYESEADLDQDISHTIFEVSESTEMTISEYIDIPILESFPYYKNIATYDKNGNEVYILQFGNSLDLSAPAWEALNYVGMKDGKYFIETDFEGVDYYLLRLSKSSNMTNPTKRFNWIFRTFDNDAQEISTPVLEFPSEITSALADDFYIASDLSIELVTAVDFGQLSSFSESMDYLALGKIDLKTEEQEVRSVLFPYKGSVSGKGKARELKVLDFNY